MLQNEIEKAKAAASQRFGHSASLAMSSTPSLSGQSQLIQNLQQLSDTQKRALQGLSIFNDREGNPFKIPKTSYYILKTSTGLVIQTKDDFMNRIQSGCFISNDFQNIKFDKNESTIDAVDRLLKALSTLDRQSSLMPASCTMAIPLSLSYNSLEMPMLALTPNNQKTLCHGYLRINEFPVPDNAEYPSTFWNWDWYRNGPGVFLNQMHRGWATATGAARVIFDLVEAPTQCEGLIIRDTSQEVYQCMTLLVLLLRIAQNRKEFNDLYTKLNRIGRLPDTDTNKAELEEVRNNISTRLNAITDMPYEVKKHYLRFLQSWKCPNDIKTLEFEPSQESAIRDVDFRNHDEIFKKVQTYAKLGRIIPTQGSIDDLAAIQNLGIPITCIDISNLLDYSDPDHPDCPALQFNLSQLPRNILIIKTSGTGAPWPNNRGYAHTQWSKVDTWQFSWLFT